MILWKRDGPTTECTGETPEAIKGCDNYEESRGENICTNRREHLDEYFQCICEKK